MPHLRNNKIVRAASPPPDTIDGTATKKVKKKKDGTPGESVTHSGGDQLGSSGGGGEERVASTSSLGISEPCLTDDLVGVTPHRHGMGGVGFELDAKNKERLERIMDMIRTDPEGDHEGNFPDILYQRPHVHIYII